MSYSLKQAAQATGKTKTTILRAIQTNKISATKDALGAWQIDPAELHRVYKPVGDADVQKTQRGASELYERLLAEKDRQIATLSEQLAEANEERRTTLRQLTALLTDQRTKTPAPEVIAMPPPPPAATATISPAPPPHVSPVPAAAAAPARGDLPSPTLDQRRENALKALAALNPAQRDEVARRVAARQAPAKAEASWWRRLVSGK